MPTELIIVARDNPELYESLRREHADHSDVEVILDRRRGERRQKNTMPWMERRRGERRSDQEVAAIGTQGWVRIRAGIAQTLPDEHPPITRAGPPTPRQVSGNLFTWTLTLNQFPSRIWRDLFVQTKDRTIDYSPDRVRFYQNNLIFESDEKMVPTWMQFLTRWLGSANERYAKYLEEQRQARVLQHEFARSQGTAARSCGAVQEPLTPSRDAWVRGSRTTPTMPVQAGPLRMTRYAAVATF